jgi:two-component system sensor histidine kinase GlrK
MRLGRPKSLSGLLLIGFALVTVPLLVAVVNATVQMRRLAQQSETLVVNGVQATRHTQDLFRETTALERTARLYNVLGDPKLQEVFEQNLLALNASLAALDRLGPDPRTRELLQAARDNGAALERAVAAGQPDSPELARAIDSFVTVNDLVSSIGERTSATIDAELGALKVAAVHTQRRLFWQAAALVPGTALIVLVFVSLLARPIRQIDQAISELGRGTFSSPVVVQGPTDLERLGRQLEWLRVRLLDLAQEKNRFLRHISHELKTPLANIREGTELLMEGAVGPLDPNQHEVVGILRENGIKLQRLIENLLSFSAWQAKSVGLELSQFALRPLIKSVVDAQQLTIAAHRIRVDVKVQDVEVTADRSKLRLILDNLLSNAVKFTPPGGTISIHALTYRAQLVIDVADTGPGIPKDERAQVFEAFYTGKAQQGGHVKGTGIGLSVVMEFVQAHGGTIELVDGVHSGAHFRIRLPMRPAATGTGAGAPTDAAA